jgi:hypothetical protein
MVYNNWLNIAHRLGLRIGAESVKIARDRNNRIEVICDIGQSEFEEVQRVIDIISGQSSPDDGHAL